MKKKQTANPQWLFLVKAWITYLGGKKETKIKKTKLSLFSGNAFGPFHGNLAGRPKCCETGHSGLIIRPVDICQSPPVPPPPCYSSWPTLKLLPGMATWPPIFLLQKSPRKSHLVICYLKAAADIHKASANCVCRPEVVSLEAFPLF